MRFPAAIIVTVIAAYALSYYLTIPANPEVQFWAGAVARREAAAAAIRGESPSRPILFFAGGSSTAFSIDPQIIEDTCQTPAINLGLPISAGAKYILHHALRQAAPGDTIIICLEPDVLTKPNQESSASKAGFALEAQRGNFTDSAGGSTFGKKTSLSDYLNISRPGARYFVTLAARTITGQGYRYKIHDIGYRGIIRTPVHNPNMEPSQETAIRSLHPQGRQLLESYAAAAQQKGVHLAYSMPCFFTDTAALTHNRANNQKILDEINTIIPVIEDPYNGAMDGIENFSDTVQHLSDQGIAIKSTAVATALKSHLTERIKQSLPKESPR